MSEGTSSPRFERAHGQTITQFINSMRIKRAGMLAANELDIVDIALDCRVRKSLFSTGCFMPILPVLPILPLKVRWPPLRAGWFTILPNNSVSLAVMPTMTKRLLSGIDRRWKLASFSMTPLHSF